MLTLYYTPGTCALATHITLEEAGAAYEARRIDFLKEEQKQPQYLAINPKARVPSLVTPHGVLTETPALLAYVAQTHPHANLAPFDDPFALARVQAFNCYLCATVHVAHAHLRRGARWASEAAAIEAMKRHAPTSVSGCFALIEEKMFVGPWVMGDAYTICDAYLFTLAGWLERDGVDPERFPRVLEHRERMENRPAVKRVLSAES